MNSLLLSCREQGMPAARLKAQKKIREKRSVTICAASFCANLWELDLRKSALSFS